MDSTLDWDKTKKHDFELDQDGLQVINDYKPGTVILCHRGVLWVTQSGNLEDYVLEPGKEFISEQHGDVLIQAMRDAVLSIHTSEKAISVRSTVLHHN
jgi:Protein of unknown function (DUF2917)